MPQVVSAYIAISFACMSLVLPKSLANSLISGIWSGNFTALRLRIHKQRYVSKCFILCSDITITTPTFFFKERFGLLYAGL